MVININVLDNGGFSLDIILLHKVTTIGELV